MLYIFLDWFLFENFNYILISLVIIKKYINILRCMHVYFFIRLWDFKTLDWGGDEGGIITRRGVREEREKGGEGKSGVGARRATTRAAPRGGTRAVLARRCVGGAG